MIVSHDRHMIELTADRLVLVDDGGATDYAGSLDDYIDFILGRNQPKARQSQAAERRQEGRRQGARGGRALKKAGRGGRSCKRPPGGACSAIDRAMFDPAAPSPTRLAADERAGPAPREDR